MEQHIDSLDFWHHSLLWVSTHRWVLTLAWGQIPIYFQFKQYSKQCTAVVGFKKAIWQSFPDRKSTSKCQI